MLNYCYDYEKQVGLTAIKFGGGIEGHEDYQKLALEAAVLLDVLRHHVAQG